LSRLTPAVDLAVATDLSHGSLGLRHDPRIMHVEIDAELEYRSGTLDDVSVAEVETEEIGVGPLVQRLVPTNRT
jgi:hypothetical protein